MRFERKGEHLPMRIRTRPGLRRIGLTGAMGLALVLSAACSGNSANRGGAATAPATAQSAATAVASPASSTSPPPAAGVIPPNRAAARATSAAGSASPVASPQTVPAVLTANAGGQSISLIDPTNHRVLETIGVGFPARSVAVSPDGRYAYVVNGAPGANSVAIIDLLTKARVGDIKVGTDPAAIALAQDGKTAFVANMGSHDVSLVDVGARVITQNLVLAPNAKPVALVVQNKPDATMIYVADQAANTVSILRVRQGYAAGTGVTTPIPVGTPGTPGAIQPGNFTTPGPASTSTGAAGAAVSPTTAAGSAGSSSSNGAANGTPSPGAIPGAGPTHISNTAVTPSANQPVGNTQAGARPITAANQDSNIVATIPVGNSPVAIATTPNAAHLYVANQGSSDVSEVDLTTLRVTQTIKVGAHLTGIAMSPTDNVAFVTADQPKSEVARIDLRTAKVTNTTAVGAGADAVTFSSDGKLAFVTDKSQSTLTVIDSTSGNVVGTVPVGPGPVSESFAPRAIVPGSTTSSNGTTAASSSPTAMASPAGPGATPSTSSTTPVPGGTRTASSPARGTPPASPSVAPLAGGAPVVTPANGDLGTGAMSANASSNSTAKVLEPTPTTGTDPVPGAVYEPTPSR